MKYNTILPNKSFSWESQLSLKSARSQKEEISEIQNKDQSLHIYERFPHRKVLKPSQQSFVSNKQNSSFSSFLTNWRQAQKILEWEPQAAACWQLQKGTADPRRGKGAQQHVLDGLLNLKILKAKEGACEFDLQIHSSNILKLLLCLRLSTVDQRISTA